MPRWQGLSININNELIFHDLTWQQQREEKRTLQHLNNIERTEERKKPFQTCEHLTYRVEEEAFSNLQRWLKV